MDHQEDHFLLQLITISPQGICPDCGNISRSRHSKYIRRFLDLPWAGIPVKVNLCVNKYYCKNEVCSRKIFTERLGEKLKPYARRTLRLTDHFTQIGYALGVDNPEQDVPNQSSELISILDLSLKKGKGHGSKTNRNHGYPSDFTIKDQGL